MAEESPIFHGAGALYSGLSVMDAEAGTERWELESLGRSHHAVQGAVGASRRGGACWGRELAAVAGKPRLRLTVVENREMSRGESGWGWRLGSGSGEEIRWREIEGM